MRIPAISFLLLALSLPALAHHGRPERECRPEWGPRHRVFVEDFRERPWVRHHPVILRGCDRRREVFFAPVPPPAFIPPPVVARPRVRIWLGF